MSHEDIENAAAPPEALNTPLMETPADSSPSAEAPAAVPPPAPSLPAGEESLPGAPRETAAASHGEAQPDTAKPDAGRAA